MIWKRYPNEFMVAVSFFLMVIAIIYKNSAVDSFDGANNKAKTSIVEIGEIISLKKQWDGKGLDKKIDKIQNGLSEDNIKNFSTKGKRLDASFVGLSDTQMNAIMLKLQNIAVQITKLDIKRNSGSYSMEIKCKW